MSSTVTELIWRPAAPLPLGLGLPTLFTDRESLYLTGGDAWVPGGDAPDGQRKIYFDAVIRYDAVADCWEKVCELPRPGIHFGAAIWRERLFVLGGTDGHAMNHQAWSRTLPDGPWQTIASVEQPALGGYRRAGRALPVLLRRLVDAGRHRSAVGGSVAIRSGDA